MRVSNGRLNASQLRQALAETEIKLKTTEEKLTATEIALAERDKAIAEAREALAAALAWIDAVPPKTALPAMPGFDRDWADAALTPTVPAGDTDPS